jgi:hypothetical protein
MVWCATSSYHLDTVLLVISMCEVCRSCMMQFGRSSTTSGRDSGLCIAIMHQATSHLLCNSPSRITFVSSTNHCTLCISLWVAFGCSLLWKWASRGIRFVNEEDIEWDGQTLEDSKRSLPPVFPTMVRSKEQMCVHYGPPL